MGFERGDGGRVGGGVVVSRFEIRESRRELAVMSKFWRPLRGGRSVNYLIISFHGYLFIISVVTKIK